jgi:cystathionine beta-lyase
MKKTKLGLNSRIIHGGQIQEKGYGAVMPPVYFTSTYSQKKPGEHLGYEYSRSGNPTRTALESLMANIESGKYGFAFSSGMAAIDAVIKTLNPGDEVVATNDLYGGTYRLFKELFSKYNVTFHFISFESIENVRKHINKKTKLIWVETPTNPMIRIIDIKKIASLTNEHKILFAVDNTFASPYLQRPLEMGADIVMHSATKFLAGHSDVILGALITNNETIANKIKFIQNASGAIPGPMDSYLTLRGIKTLHIRMQRHCENAKKIANFLNSHPKVSNVFWPGLKDHPAHLVAKKQMSDYGSWSVARDREDTLHASCSPPLVWWYVRP